MTLIRTLTALPVLALLVAQAAAAQESRLATQSIRCAAIFTVVAQVSDPDAAQRATAQQAVTIFSEVHRREFNGKPPTEPAARIDTLLREFRDTLATREPYLVEESVLCGAWFDGFRVQGDDWSYVPVIPKVISASARTQYTALGSDAFKRWGK